MLLATPRLFLVPFKMLRIVPLGDFHIFFRLNSFTRASSGVMVAHLMPTPTLCSMCGIAGDRNGSIACDRRLAGKLIGMNRESLLQLQQAV